MNIQRDGRLVDRDDVVVGVLLRGRTRAGINLNSDLTIVLDIVIETQRRESRPHFIGIAEGENCPRDNGAERGEEGKQPQRPKNADPARGKLSQPQRRTEERPRRNCLHTAPPKLRIVPRAEASSTAKRFQQSGLIPINPRSGWPRGPGSRRAPW